MLVESWACFVDGIAFVSVGGLWDYSYKRAGTHPPILQHWFDTHILAVNIDKSKCLPIYTRSDFNPGPEVNLTQ